MQASIWSPLNFGSRPAIGVTTNSIFIPSALSKSNVTTPFTGFP